jgi:hypothetical protein
MEKGNSQIQTVVATYAGRDYIRKKLSKKEQAILDPLVIAKESRELTPEESKMYNKYINGVKMNVYHITGTPEAVNAYCVAQGEANLRLDDKADNKPLYFRDADYFLGKVSNLRLNTHTNYIEPDNTADTNINMISSFLGNIVSKESNPLLQQQLAKDAGSKIMDYAWKQLEAKMGITAVTPTPVDNTDPVTGTDLGKF